NADPENVVMPAHVWTPWFGMFGSKSGFDSLEECFEELTPKIFCIETGLSSDPLMNWQMSRLDKIALVSNSDAHSPEKLGREANIFDTDLSYKGIVDAIKTKDRTKFLYTIEFYPEEGKYHYDGHRLCNISLTPGESKKYNNMCPVCGKPLILGVLNRINQLADRKLGFKPDNAIPYKSLIPLEEVVADSLGQNVGTKQVLIEYNQLLSAFKTEFNILENVSEKDLMENTQEKIAKGIVKARTGQVYIEPGYDGVFGKIKIFSDQETKRDIPSQETLFS
ncbi:MAG: endonuclease Q family protein, partial [Candidatus Paceibacterota bacterium]